MDSLGTRLNPAPMSTLPPTTKEEINEFLKAGHEQYVGTEERVQIIQQFLNRKRQRELDLGDLCISEKRRTVKIEKSIGSCRRSPRLAVKTASQYVRAGYFDQRRRLTNRVNENVTKPRMKLGIFNHFCKSRNVKMRTFDETQIIDTEEVEFKPIEIEDSEDLSTERVKGLPDVKTIEELTSDRFEYPIYPVRELSVIDPGHVNEPSKVSEEDTEKEPAQFWEDMREGMNMSETSFAFMLDMIFDSSSDDSTILKVMSGLYSSTSDEFSSASSDSLSSSIF